MSRLTLFVVFGFALSACSDGNFQVAEAPSGPTDSGDDATPDTSTGGDATLPSDAAVDSGGGSVDATPDTARDTSTDVAPEIGTTCDRVTYEPSNLSPGGYVCGVGGCRAVLKGTGCQNPDGGSPCPAVFGQETKPDDADDNCNGVIDEGRKVASSNAGFECRSCAFGRKVQRLADGTIVTQHNPPDYYGDYANNAACINSDLCKLPGKQWVRHASHPTATTCNQFCKLIGRSCADACTTTGCAGAANASNLGTYAADYQCMSNGTPLTGGCDVTLPAVQPIAAFNVYCCCAM